jgi:hypothetical protein
MTDPRSQRRLFASSLMTFAFFLTVHGAHAAPLTSHATAQPAVTVAAAIDGLDRRP